MTQLKLWLHGAVLVLLIGLTMLYLNGRTRLSEARSDLAKANVQVQGLTQAVSTLQAREKALTKAVQDKENESAKIEVRYRTKIKLVPAAVPDGAAVLTDSELQWLRNRTTSPASSEATATP